MLAATLGMAPGGTVVGLFTRDLRFESRATIRKATRTAFHPPCGQPDAITEDMRWMTCRALAATAGAPVEYLKRPSLPTRLAVCT